MYFVFGFILGCLGCGFLGGSLEESVDVLVLFLDLLVFLNFLSSLSVFLVWCWEVVSGFGIVVGVGGFCFVVGKELVLYV